MFELVLIAPVAAYLYAQAWTVVRWRGVWRVVAVLPIPLILYGLILSWRYRDNFEEVVVTFLLPVAGGLFLACSAAVKLLVAEAAGSSKPGDGGAN